MKYLKGRVGMYFAPGSQLWSHVILERGGPYEGLSFREVIRELRHKGYFDRNQRNYISTVLMSTSLKEEGREALYLPENPVFDPAELFTSLEYTQDEDFMKVVEEDEVRIKNFAEKGQGREKYAKVWKEVLELVKTRTDFESMLEELIDELDKVDWDFQKINFYHEYAMSFPFESPIKEHSYSDLERIMRFTAMIDVTLKYGNLYKFEYNDEGKEIFRAPIMKLIVKDYDPVVLETEEGPVFIPYPSYKISFTHVPLKYENRWRTFFFHRDAWVWINAHQVTYLLSPTTLAKLDEKFRKVFCNYLDDCPPKLINERPSNVKISGEGYIGRVGQVFGLNHLFLPSYSLYFVINKDDFIESLLNLNRARETSLVPLGMITIYELPSLRHPDFMVEAKVTDVNTGKEIETVVTFHFSGNLAYIDEKGYMEILKLTDHLTCEIDYPRYNVAKKFIPIFGENLKKYYKNELIKPLMDLAKTNPTQFSEWKWRVMVEEGLVDSFPLVFDYNVKNLLFIEKTRKYIGDNLECGDPYSDAYYEDFEKVHVDEPPGGYLLTPKDF